MLTLSFFFLSSLIPPLHVSVRCISTSVSQKDMKQSFIKEKKCVSLRLQTVLQPACSSTTPLILSSPDQHCVSCPPPLPPHPASIPSSSCDSKTKASPEVKVENSTRSLAESRAEASVETARCSVRDKHVELQVCNSRLTRRACHGDDDIYRLTLLYMELAQLAD